MKTIATALSRQVVGKRVTGVTWHSGRYVTHGPPKNEVEFLASLPAVVKKWTCKGKFQYFVLDTEQDHRSAWITLGMSGRFYFCNVNEDGEDLHKHSRVIFHLENTENEATADLVFVDARNFGTVHFCLDEETLEKKLDGLGPDILADELTLERFLEICNAKKNPKLNGEWYIIHSLCAECPLEQQ